MRVLYYSSIQLKHFGFQTKYVSTSLATSIQEYFLVSHSVTYMKKIERVKNLFAERYTEMFQIQYSRIL